MGILITFFLGVFILLGAAIAKSAKNEKLIEQLSISIAFGTMSALTLTELIPEAVEGIDFCRHIDSENIGQIHSGS